MTAIRERQNAPTPDPDVPSRSERAAFGTFRGVPLWLTILLPAVATIIGTVLDIVIWSTPGLLFKTCFLVGSALAVGLARRKNVFGPMVQPPLVAAIAMPVVVLLTGSGSSASSGGVTAKALTIVQPLIGSFPIMAITSGVTVGFGLVRMFVLQRNKDDPDNSEARTKKHPVPGKKKSAEKTPERPAPRRERPDGPRARNGDPRREEPRRRDPRKAGPRGNGPREEQARSGRPRKEDPRGGGPRGAEPNKGDPRGGRPARGRPPAEPGPQPRQRGEGRPDRGDRPAPPPRGRPERPAPGRGKPPEPGGEPPRRPRRPRRGDSFD